MFLTGWKRMVLQMMTTVSVAVTVANLVVVMRMTMMESAFACDQDDVVVPSCALLQLVLLPAALAHVFSSDVLDSLTRDVLQLGLLMSRLVLPLSMTLQFPSAVGLVRELHLGFCALADAFCPARPWSNLVFVDVVVVA